MVGLEWNSDGSVEVLCLLPRISGLGFQRAWAPLFFLYESPASSSHLNQQPGPGQVVSLSAQVRSSSQHEVLSLPLTLLKALWKGKTQSLWVPRLMRQTFRRQASFLLLYAFSKDNTNSSAGHNQEPKAPRLVLTTTINWQIAAFKFSSFQLTLLWGKGMN